MELVFGWRSATLLVVVGILVPLAIALARTLRNRLANRLLAILILVLAGVLVPWLIGFMGAYDRWPWLTFLPVAVPLAVPVLLRFYVDALLGGRLPARWRLMLAPALVQFAFQAISFALPQPLKGRWAGVVFSAIDPLFTLALIATFALHVTHSARALRRYRAALADVTGDEARFAARWLTAALIAFAVLWMVWGLVLLWDWASPLGYFGLQWLYLAIAAVALFLAIEGWRHSGDPFPTWPFVTPTAPEAGVPADELAGESEAAPEPARATPARDWQETGVDWAARIETQGWALDPDIDLAGLARLLGTNTAYLSRALNEGLGVNFATFVNGLRSRAVMQAIAAGDRRDVLTLALDAGFSSKASFNRAFAATAGMTPSAWRKHVSEHEKGA